MKSIYYYYLRFVFFAAVFGLLAAACDALPVLESGPPQNVPVERSGASDSQISAMQAALAAAREKIAADLRIDPDAIQFQVINRQQWEDTCLGIAIGDETCAPEVTSGYGGTFALENEQYEYRIDETGENVRVIPAAVSQARQAIGREFGVPPQEVDISSYERVDWEDSCLGIAKVDIQCAQTVTPGYRVVFIVEGLPYEYRTDLGGSLVDRFVEPEGPVTIKPTLSWIFQGEGFCQAAAINPQKISIGECGQELTGATFARETYPQDLFAFADKYAPFRAETPAGAVDLSGTGRVTATASEQRMIAEWARQVFLEAQAGAADPSAGLVYSWHREGGVAGFCDDVAFFLSGEAVIDTCKGGAPESLSRLRLRSSQLDALYNLYENVSSFEQVFTDTAGADAMTVRISVTGLGASAPTEDELELMGGIAAELFAQSQLVQRFSEIDGARTALTGFFKALSEGRYLEAARYYGGSTEQLVSNNPDLPPDDLAGLLEAACTRNGYNCLPLLAIADELQLTVDTFRFGVEFRNPEGTLFELGPCCGATEEEMPPVHRFDYTVLKQGDSFLVQELPPYVP